MPRVFCQQEDVTFIDWNFQRGFARRFHHANKNIPFQLIKEFFGGVVMVISPLIWSAYNGHHHLAVFPNLSVTDWRLEFCLVLFHPALKIEWLQTFYGWHLRLLSHWLVSHDFHLDQQVWMR